MAQDCYAIISFERPDNIVVWVAAEDLPTDLQKRLSRSSFVQDGSTIRCENIYLIYDDPATLIVADGKYHPFPE